MNIPQLMMIMYFSVMVLGGLVLNGKPKTGKYSFAEILIECMLLFMILYAGGFWE